MQLNEDTLEVIYIHLNSKDARALSTTARMFYGPARRYTAQDVAFRSFRKAVTFCDYMIRSNPDLLPLLWSFKIECLPTTREVARRSVEIQEEEEYRAGASKIADLLQQVSHLKVLALHEAELLMVYQPRIAVIVASMPLLQDLELHDIGPRVSSVLRRLRSTPEKVALAGCTPWPSFASTFVPRRWSAGPMNISFPSVSALSLKEGCRHPPTPDTLAHMFPNVVRLDLGAPPSECQEAMRYIQPVAVALAVHPSYPAMRELLAHDRNPRLRYVIAEDPTESLRMYSLLPELQGMWVSVYLPRRHWHTIHNNHPHHRTYCKHC